MIKSHRSHYESYGFSSHGRHHTKFGICFYMFNNNLCVPRGFSGRTTSCYIDYETSGQITDYNGVSGDFHELTSVHVEQTEYNLSIASAYIKYFLGIQNED